MNPTVTQKNRQQQIPLSNSEAEEKAESQLQIHKRFDIISNLCNDY